jgi:hypothetical protein
MVRLRSLRVTGDGGYRDVQRRDLLPMLVHQGLVGVLVQHPIEENLAVSVLRTGLLKAF